jgi:hypothetical protein
MVFAMKQKQQIVPTHPAWTHSGLRKRIGCTDAAAREFAAAPAAALLLMILILLLIPI